MNAHYHSLITYPVCCFLCGVFFFFFEIAMGLFMFRDTLVLEMANFQY